MESVNEVSIPMKSRYLPGLGLTTQNLHFTGMYFTQVESLIGMGPRVVDSNINARISPLLEDGTRDA